MRIFEDIFKGQFISTVQIAFLDVIVLLVDVADTYTIAISVLVNDLATKVVLPLTVRNY